MLLRSNLSCAALRVLLSYRLYLQVISSRSLLDLISEAQRFNITGQTERNQKPIQNTTNEHKNDSEIQKFFEFVECYKCKENHYYEDTEQYSSDTDLKVNSLSTGDSRSLIIYVKFKIVKKTNKALVDTGSDFNIIRKDIDNKLNLQQHFLTIFSAKHADGTKINGLKEILKEKDIITTDFDNNSINSQEQFVLSETCSISCILGMPWCLTHQPTIVWETARIELTRDEDHKSRKRITLIKIRNFLDDL
jgi:hypothetical protein